MASSGKRSRNNAVLIIGGLLIVYGVYKLAQRLFSPWWSAIVGAIRAVVRVAWPIAIVLAAVFVFVAVRKGAIVLPKGRTLYRSADDRVLGGVCGGIARFFGVDSGVVRVVAVALLIASTMAVGLIYIVLWLIAPKEPSRNGSWV